MKKIVLITLTTISLFSKSATATKSCEAFNNLKHTKNYGNVVLKPDSSYQILRQLKGNYFIKVPNAKPMMRWVSVGCFNGTAETKVESKSTKPEVKEKKSIFSRLFGKKSESKNEVSKTSLKSSGNLDAILVLSWHNTFCETHSNKKECKQNGGDAKNHLVLHGLWPQPRNKEYCGLSGKIKQLDRSKRWNAMPKLDLNSNVLSLMQKYMPGVQSNLQRHEYYKHGSCYSKDANGYFNNALTLTKEIDGTIGDYLRENIGKKVKAINLKLLASKVYGKDIKNKIAIKCKGRVLSEIWISTKGKGNNIKSLIKGAKPIRSNCQEAIVDAPGKFRRF